MEQIFLDAGLSRRICTGGVAIPAGKTAAIADLSFRRHLQFQPVDRIGCQFQAVDTSNPAVAI